MSAFIVDQGATVQCLHLGTAQPLFPSLRVQVDGKPLVTIASPYVIGATCSLTGTTVPPCATGQFTTGAQHVLSDGAFVAVALGGMSTCIPTGTPLFVLASQVRVIAS